MNGHASNHGEKEKYLGSLEIRRPVYKTQTFRDRYMKTEDDRKSLTGSFVDKVRGSFQCKPEKRKNCLCNVFPFFGILRKYKWREDLPNDIIAGLTVGIMQLPQGDDIYLLFSFCFLFFLDITFHFKSDYLVPLPLISSQYDIIATSQSLFLQPHRAVSSYLYLISVCFLLSVAIS